MPLYTHRHLSEFNRAIRGPSEWLSPTQRKALARESLGIGPGDYVSIADGTSTTIDAENSGKVHYFGDQTAANTIDLPEPEQDMEFDFVYIGGALDAHGIVLDTQSNTNFFKGGVVHMDMNADDAADELVAVYPNGSSNSKLTMSSVGAGTRIKIKSLDGVTWTVIVGLNFGNTAPVFADQ